MIRTRNLCTPATQQRIAVEMHHFWLRLQLKHTLQSAKSTSLLSSKVCWRFDKQQEENRLHITRLVNKHDGTRHLEDQTTDLQNTGRHERLNQILFPEELSPRPPLLFGDQATVFKTPDRRTQIWALTWKIQSEPWTQFCIKLSRHPKLTGYLKRQRRPSPPTTRHGIQHRDWVFGLSLKARVNHYDLSWEELRQQPSKSQWRMRQKFGIKERFVVSIIIPSRAVGNHLGRHDAQRIQLHGAQRKSRKVMRSS